MFAMSAFPRGGGSKSSSSAPSSEKDVLFGGSKRLQRMEDGSKRKGKGSAKSAAELQLAMGVSKPGLGMLKEMSGKQGKRIEPLVFGKYNIGCSALGYVLRLTNEKAIISLPGGSVGTVAFHEVSDVLYAQHLRDSQSRVSKSKQQTSIRKYLKIHQCVRVAVLQIEEMSDSKKKSMHLTMRSSVVNKYMQDKYLGEGIAISGCVTSKEDHGYVIGVGIPDAKCFLPFNSCPEDGKEMIKGKSVSYERSCMVW